MRTQPWGLSKDDFREVIRRLRFRHRKWDVRAGGRCLVLPESLVLTAEEHHRVVTTVERFSALLAGVERRLAHSREALERLGIPRESIELLLREPADGPLQLARYDLFPSADGRWWVSEFNEDAPGGFNEAVGVPDLLGGRAPGGRFLGDLRGALQGAFRGSRRVAFIHATGYAEDLQHMLVVHDWLAQAGIDGVLCSPAHLEWRWGRPSFLGKSVDRALRFYPGEWFRWLPNRDTWARALPRLPMMNPLRRLIRQSKRLFIDWGGGDGWTDDDRRWVRDHAPLSEPYRADQLDRWVAERPRWVLKEAFGRMGDSVVLGAMVGDAEWIRTLTEAARRPGDFLMQERFEVAPIRFEEGPMYPALGAYVVNGRFAGYYSRVAAQPITTHEACHVATLVEDT